MELCKRVQDKSVDKSRFPLHLRCLCREHRVSHLRKRLHQVSGSVTGNWKEDWRKVVNPHCISWMRIWANAVSTN
jgi:hypothetical protein